MLKDWNYKTTKCNVVGLSIHDTVCYKLKTEQWNVGVQNNFIFLLLISICYIISLGIKYFDMTSSCLCYLQPWTTTDTI